ncbi:hypothetical protein RA280_16130 [Cupriavidus sp. CV2]|uniref:hypothetical protein n=1 Tax=Cupriavidus ulmosensis TaxID=3065913 RepID=UPI00296AACCC|nr:hypothetical protein [Cupriavidus sp. CV2]MDW3683251.1 hypothetical protein [Cupriavidus sp. CV2]
MQNKIKLTLSAISIASLLALAACGGGGGDSAPAKPADTPTPPPAPTITVQGSATAVAGDPLAVVFVPQTETSTKSVPQSIASNVFPAQFQKASAAGAYTQFGIDANSLITLATGKIVDVAGNGSYAIGRWTAGSSSIGSMSVNQGAHYVVGKPLTLTPFLPPTPAGVKANCSLVASTSPTAVSGNFAPGKVNSASAVVDIAAVSLEALDIDVTIGSDAHATTHAALTSITGVMISQGSLRHVQTLGSDPLKPFLAVGYAMPTPSSGDVTGVVVLQCQ